jgi:MFS transporter, Spinster family, sphingosine-1-phosphate transporter
LAAALPGARLSLALLLAINLFNYLDRYILAAVEKPIRDKFFAPDDPDAKFWTGSLATAFLVSYMLAAPVFGWLSDRTRRWLIVGVGVILWSLASGGTGIAATFGMLLFTRVFVGIGEAAYGPAAPTLISDLFPVRKRGSVMAWFYMAIPVGGAAGYAFGGFMEDHWGWRSAFYAVVIPGLLLGAACFLMKEPARGGSDGIACPTRRARLSEYLILARTPSFMLNTAGMTAMTFAVGGISFWMPTYIHEFRGQPDLQRVNMVFGIITVATGLTATLLGGYLSDVLRPRVRGAYFVVSGVSMLAAFPMILLMIAAPFPWAWVFVVFAEFCLFLNTGPTNTILANVTHPCIRSSAFALNILIIHALGDAVSPPLIGWLTGLTSSASHPTGNMNVGFAAVAVAILVGGVLWLWGARYLERDTELAPTRIG